MRRYDEIITKISTEESGVQRYESIRYPKFEVKPSDQYIITKEMDRLDLIAYDFYNDTTKWWIISRANNLPGGSLRVKAGTRLRIPWPLSEYNLLISIQKAQF